jgi:hypothetical protein
VSGGVTGITPVPICPGDWRNFAAAFDTFAFAAGFA